jgi:hypothetical protein
MLGCELFGMGAYCVQTAASAALAVSDVSSSGLVAVTVSNPGTSGGVSTSLMLAIDSNIQTYLVAKTASFTVTRGQGASAQLIFSNLPQGALTSADCFNLPAGVNCSYNAQTQMITLTTSLNTPARTYQILVVDTVNPSTTVWLNGHSSQGGLFYAMLGLPFGLMWIGRKRRRWLYPAAVSIVVSATGVVPSLNLNCPAAVYTGTPHVCTAAPTPFVASTTSIAYNGSATLPVTAGNYPVVASFVSSYYPSENTSASATLVIRQATPTFTVNCATISWTGSPQGCTTTATGIARAALSGTIGITYNGSTTPPTDPGTYAVVATFAPSDPDYSSQTITSSFTINSR